MPSVDRLPYEDRLDDLLYAYEQAQRALVAQVEQALADGNLHRARIRRQQLAAALRVLEDLGRRTDPRARSIIQAAADESAKLTAQHIGLSLTGVQESTFVAANAEAIAELEAIVLGRLGDARATVGRQVEDVFAQAGRRSMMQALLGAQGSRRDATEHMVRQLEQRGIGAFTDASGRQWKLDHYARMALRTGTRQAVVEAAKNRMAAQGLRLGRISRHASSCKICGPWENRLVSLDGSVSDYFGEAVSDFGAMPSGGPPFHPNCRHTIFPVAEEIDALRRTMEAA